MHELRSQRASLLKAARGLAAGDYTLAGGFSGGGALSAAEGHDVYLPLILRDSPWRIGGLPLSVRCQAVQRSASAWHLPFRLPALT
jgi:hypothetical protein